MSDTPNPPASPPNSLDPVAVLSALGNPQRWQIIGQMAKGEFLTLNGLVTSTKRNYNAVHKDMKVLLASGAVAIYGGEDKRVGLFAIPVQFRPRPGIVDYGFCRLRFGVAEPELSERIAKD